MVARSRSNCCFEYPLGFEAAKGLGSDPVGTYRGPSRVKSSGLRACRSLRPDPEALPAKRSSNPVQTSAARIPNKRASPRAPPREPKKAARAHRKPWRT